MCDATFTFGQRGSHYFQSPSRRDYTRLPKKLHRLLTSSQIAQVYNVTLGFENSFLITYQDKDGRDAIGSEGLPEELDDFVYATDPQNRSMRDIAQIRLTLGPQNSSFFVSDGQNYLWMNLPPRLFKALQSRIRDGAWFDKPRIVALGVDHNFLLITQKQSAVWDLSHYRTLAAMLEFSKSQEGDLEEVKSVNLHGYRYQGFVVQSSNGTLLHENLPQWSMEGITGMKEPIARDSMEVEVRRRQADLQRRPSLRERNTSERAGRRELEQVASLKRDWGKKKQLFEGKSKGLRVSLSLSISAGGIGFGKILR
ncbi:hypothetical protein K491DRAFT_597589 [Lophiostoma macrostomum CBS 122681]|uniref:Uncharacterized protein n=1 Tax=Lophiostoma macrostomum CBS 122681 TaxID=1314788 RepID=A0A6A6TB49_9PLEO|nr:hypothetical protein K491DRAFT_597589 [Lophiostoma macrostomum CBS 122681]